MTANVASHRAAFVQFSERHSQIAFPADGRPHFYNWVWTTPGQGCRAPPWLPI